jgi:oligosaccharide repeat unit polymerase
MNIVLLLLFFIISFSFIIFYYKKEKDIFHPGVFICGYYLLLNIPYLLIISLNPESISSLINLSHNTPDNAISKFLIIQTFYTIFLYIGIHFGRKRKFTALKSKIISIQKVPYVPVLFYLTLFLTVFCFADYLISNGGIQSILYRISVGGRSEMISSNFLSQFLFISISILACLLHCMYVCEKLSGFAYFFGILLILLIGLTSGGRGNALDTIMVILITYNFVSNRISVRYIFKLLPLVFIIFVPVIMIMPLLRNTTNMENFIDNPTDFIMENVQDSLDKQTNIYSDISRAYIPIFITDYFNEDNYWHGRSFKDLFLSFIPRRFYKEKPPVDDGIYITALMNGYNVAPSMALEKIPANSSCPPRNYVWYANFGLLGLLVSGFIVGKLCMFFYYKVYTEKGIYFLLLIPKILSANLSIGSIFGLCRMLILLYLLIFFAKFLYRLKPHA